MTQVKFLLIGMFVLFAFSMSAIDWGVYKSAKEFEKEKRYDEAIAVYEKAIAGAKNDNDEQQYMVWAINIADGALKDHERAVKLAERIKNPERRAFVLMSLYKPEEIVSKFKDVDFMTWPEDIRAESYKNRGIAYNSLKKYEKALPDLEKAFALPGDSHVVKGASANIAGDIYLSNMKDEAKAEEMYRNALSTTKAGYAWRNESLLKLTDLLLKNKKNKEALALYDGIDTKIIDIPYWKIAVSRGYSKALAANNEKLKALEQLNIALQTESKPEVKKQIQAEIDKLSEDML